ncbi:hypothetical protein FCIRC_4667 [Fusarium circinatum]|uniref:Uncharacterized protein n=1 Tax=Fusarium circinatum TaxID=48490 RepID=A0A8H5U7X9_FUSCI|nr:hypothetical protein FCIRC_4667 [Fusarium circinatum]
MMPSDSEIPDSRVRVDLPDVDFLSLPWEYLEQPPEDAQSPAAETETEVKQESHETETDAEKHAEPSEEAQPQSIPDTARIKACPVYTRMLKGNCDAVATQLIIALAPGSPGCSGLFPLSLFIVDSY